MRYLTPDDIARVNEREVGSRLLIDRGLLESSASRPQQSAGGEDAYPDIHSMAAALLHSLAKNHVFVDGNKRTAVVATGLLYLLNGLWLLASQDEVVELVLEVIEERLTTVEAIAARRSSFVKELPLSE